MSDFVVFMLNSLMILMPVIAEFKGFLMKCSIV